MIFSLATMILGPLITAGEEWRLFHEFFLYIVMITPHALARFWFCLNRWFELLHNEGAIPSDDPVIGLFHYLLIILKTVLHAIQPLIVLTFLWRCAKGISLAAALCVVSKRPSIFVHVMQIAVLFFSECQIKSGIWISTTHFLTLSI